MSNSKNKPLSRKQLAVIDDLFDGTMSEAKVMKKHTLQKHVLRRWLASEAFMGELNLRIESAQRQSELVIAQYVPTAATKLVELASCKKEETARKACLDIIALRNGHPAAGACDRKDAAVKQTDLDAETAGRILAALAEANK